MKKKLNIKGVPVSYEKSTRIPQRFIDEAAFYKRIGFPKSALEIYQSALEQQKEQIEYSKEKQKQEQEKIVAKERERLEHQASLDVSTLPPGIFEAEPQLPTWQVAIAGFVIIALCILAVLAFAAAG